MARKPLGTKPQSIIVEPALKLKALGYDPIWLYAGKGAPPDAWPNIKNEPGDIRNWHGKSLALRMRGHDDLLAIDLDIQRQDILDQVIAAWTARWPDFMAKCVIRHSGAVKCMLIGRLTTARKRMYSGRYGVTEEHKGGNRVEVFTANDSQYIAVWGMHSPGRDYGYDGSELTETAYSDLPEFSDEDLNELLDIPNKIMEAAGLALSERPGEDVSEIAYDLTPEMVCEPKKSDGKVTLKELEDLCLREFVYVHGRVFDPGSDSYRVKCKVTPGRGLTMWDFGDGKVHYWKHLGPQLTVLGPLLERLKLEAAVAPETSMFRATVKLQLVVDNVRAQAAAAGGTASMEAPPIPPAGADFDDHLRWMTMTYGYCALNDTVMVMYEASMDCEWKPGAFERRFRSLYREEPVGRTGAMKKVYVTDDWAVSESRFHVDGARMHPGQPFPMYREGGKLFKNVYQRPVHAGDGDLTVFWSFFNKFIPDPVEREWLLDWMAHKQWKPEIPGSAVILVADNDEDEDERTGKFGTGRGSMFKILHKLYGPEYSRSQSFSVLDGSSSQSAYNSWIHGNVLVTVDETKTSATAHRRGEKKSVYEVLKDLVDPAPKGMTFNVKYGRAFWGYSYCSFWMATNHADALSIPKNDRRFTVLNNGPVLTPGEGRALAEWMSVPGNIAALSRFLEARVAALADFNMFQHLETAGKQTMVEMGRSNVEEVLIELRDDDSRGLVFTKQQLEHAVQDIVDPWERKNGQEKRRGNNQWRGEFSGAFGEYCVGLKNETGTKLRVRIDGRQVKLYCFRKRRAAAAELPDAARRVQAAKWGGSEAPFSALKGLKGGKGPQEKDD